MRGAPKKVYFNTNEVADMIGMTRKQACYWLKREGAVEKRGRRYYTTMARLMSAFPDAFQAFGK